MSRSKVIRLKDLVPRTKPGTFLAVELTPNRYLYARKLSGLSGYVFYDLLTEEAFSELDVIASRPILLTIDLLTKKEPDWLVVGNLPLPPNWPPPVRYWTIRPLPLTKEEVENHVIKPATEYFIIEETSDQPKLTPAKFEDIKGLTKWTLYTPEFILDKLRLHYGFTAVGEIIKPVPLSQQPPW